MNKVKANKIKVLIKALLTAIAFTTVFHAPLVRAEYETMDYLTASVYELLGNYNLTFLLVAVTCGGFYHWLQEQGSKAGEGPKMQAVQGKKGPAPYSLLALFFAFCILLGRSYHEVGTWAYCFGSLVNFTKFLLCLAGYAVFFQAVLSLLEQLWERARKAGRESGAESTGWATAFFEKHPFRNTFLCILLAYTPIILLSYPGNLCWDVVGQIEQVILGSGYSAHHPLFHTLIVGGMTQLGETLFGSYEVGLFLYIWLQTLMLAAVMAATVAVLAKRGVSAKWLWGLVALYVLTPIYSNLTSTAIKDVPFTAAVIGYLICFALLLESPALLKNVRFVLGFVALQVAVILLRNNGLPLVVLSGVGGFLMSFKKYNLKERLQSLLVYFAAGMIIGSLFSSVLAGVCGASSGSKGEMLSIFFQQTARYSQLYRTELTVEETQAIEAVLGDINQVAAAYDPDISDPVKALFKKDATTGELVNYIGTWFKGFFKHPAVYFEAFFAHIYGWFSPEIANAIRYECDYETIGQGLLFWGAEKVLIFLYRFANRFTLLGILENVGLAVWALFFYSNQQRKAKRKEMLAASLPLWISLLVCMASPCFFGHPRYALPIMLGVPFLFGFALSGRTENPQPGKSAAAGEEA